MQDNTSVFPVDIANFEQDVIERSKNTLVLLDFWADWCEPCKQLTPVLTKVVESYEGRVVLAKANADEQQELAQHLNVRSLPTVMAVKDGQIVDGFTGVQPEQGIRAFIDKHIPPPDSENELGDLSQMDADQALSEIQSAISADPENLDLAKSKLDLLIRLGDSDAALDYLAELEGNTEFSEEHSKNSKLRIELIKLASEASEKEVLDSVSKDPNDWDAQCRLAAIRVGEENYGDAMDILLSIVMRNRMYRDDFARKALVALFGSITDHDLVRSYRRKLASALN